jgi:hypothetical protein
MAAHASVSHKPLLLSITGCSYEYQLDGRWPRPPEAPYLRLRGYWLQHAGVRGTTRESYRRRRVHHDCSGTIILSAAAGGWAAGLSARSFGGNRKRSAVFEGIETIARPRD